MMRGLFPLMALSAAGCASIAPPVAGGGAAPGGSGGYVVYVVSEAVDQLSRIRVENGKGRVEDQRRVGIMPTEIDGPHGVAVSPDARHVYVTLGHGTPFGSLWKISTETGDVLQRTALGLFPATVDVTPDGQYGFVSNFNLHGDHVPSSISKVHLPTMAEVARTETCVMPHGSRVNPQGTRQYSVCMMDQVLVEMDVATGSVSRRFSVVPGMEGAEHVGMQHGAQSGKVCSPTWAQPSADGSRVFVACNRSAEILEIDVAAWTVSRRLSTGEAPYNLAVTPDGRYLLATLKNRTAPATEVFELSSGRSVARIPNSTVLPHGVAVSPDSRYAFVSVEGVGAEAGKVDIIDLRSLQRVDSVEVGQQAAGIAVSPLSSGG